MRTLLLLLAIAASFGSYAASASRGVIRGISNHHAQKLQRQGRHLEQFCGQCIWQGNTVCEARANYLVANYENLATLDKAKTALMEQKGICISNDGEPDIGDPNEASSSLPLDDIFCGTCQYQQASFNCDSRIDYLVNTYSLTDENAQKAVLELGHCANPGVDLCAYYPDLDFNAGCDDVDEAQEDSMLDSIMIWCGECAYQQTGATCDEKAQALANEDVDLTLEGAKASILKDCFNDPNSTNSEIQSEEEESSSSLSIVGIVGIIIAIILLLVICVQLALWSRKKKRAEEEDVPQDEKQGTDVDVENPVPVMAEAVVVESQPPECAPQEEKPDPPGLNEPDPPGLNEKIAPEVEVEEPSSPEELAAAEDAVTETAEVRGSIDPDDDSHPSEAKVVGDPGDSTKEEEASEEMKSAAPGNVNEEAVVERYNRDTNQDDGGSQEMEQDDAEDVSETQKTTESDASDENINEEAGGMAWEKAALGQEDSGEKEGNTA